MMAWFEASKSEIWNLRYPILEVLWVGTEIPITGVLIAMTDECGFVTKLINANVKEIQFETNSA